MMKRLVLPLAVWLLGCTPGPDVPADPVWGKQACAHCSMLVSEKQSAAQLTLKDGTREHFDDVGCLAAHVAQLHEPARHLWVHKGTGWVEAESAKFASGAVTPMDFGFVAADTGAGWGEVMAAVRARSEQTRRMP